MKTEAAHGISVQLKHAEKMRKYLSEKQLLRKDLKIKKENNFIYFPVKNSIKEINSYKAIKKDFEKIEEEPKSYKAFVSVPNSIKKELPTSFDVIGNIILIKLNKTLLKYKKEIGTALLKSNKNIETVFLTEPVFGELRTRNIEFIAGKRRTTTTHTEFGLKFDVDVKKIYFSPRLSSERKRVANLVKSGEIVVDMFTGVAPFSIMMAKYANPKIIYAFDKNKDAIKYAKRNIRNNNVLDKIEIIHADVRDVQKILTTKADRIIMNLPLSAHLFFGNALQIAKDNCITHYYDILEEEKIQERIKELKTIAKDHKTVFTDISVRKIKTYSPREFYIGIDITAKKMPM